jgi:hypothetical protein
MCENLVLLSCGAAFITGIVIAGASLSAVKGREDISPRSIQRTGGAPPRRDARRQTAAEMSLVSAAVRSASLLAHAQGVTSHYLGTPAPAFARWIILLSEV